MLVRYIMQSAVLVLILPTVGVAKVSYKIPQLSPNAILDVAQFSKMRQIASYNRLYLGSSINSEPTSDDTLSVKDLSKENKIPKYRRAGVAVGAGLGAASGLIFSFPFFCSLHGGSGFEPPREFVVACLEAYFIVQPLSAALGATIGGKLSNENGSFKNAWIGAIAGAGTGALLSVLLPPEALFIGGIITTTVGATIGYNWSE